MSDCARNRGGQGGYTLVETLVGIVVFAAVLVSALSLFLNAYTASSYVEKRSMALNMASNQIEHLRSLPYDRLAIEGGSIISDQPLPASVTKNGLTMKTTITYVDDAGEKEGCAHYPTLADKLSLCRNSTESTPMNDTNPADYKAVNVKVFDGKNRKLAETDTLVASHVAETASLTGSVVIRIVDGSGNPVPGATVIITNDSVSPAVDLTCITTDEGLCVFYNLPPGSNYVVKASKIGYSTIWTVPAQGNLQPIYPNISLVAQQTSAATLILKPQGPKSMIIETVDANGNPLSGMHVYIKGGYKKYINPDNTVYYFDDRKVPSVTDANGLTSVDNLTNLFPEAGYGLVPGEYFFCGDGGKTKCNNTSGGSASSGHYLMAAIPYDGTTPFSPVTVREFNISITDPAIQQPPQYLYNGEYYLQKVRLVFASNSAAVQINGIPNGFRVSASAPADALSAYEFTITGNNLNIASNAVKLVQGTTEYPATCTTSSMELRCTVNLVGVQPGIAALNVDNGAGKTFSASTVNNVTPKPLGGIIIDP